MNGVDWFFADTNLLIYSIDPNEGVKYDAAQRWVAALWASGSGRLSWQVLNEFYSTALRKTPRASADARNDVLALINWDPIDTSADLIERAWHWTDNAQLSYWDALIVAAAEAAGCRWLLTEDLQNKRTLGAVTIVNPFRTSPGDFGLPVPQ